MITNNVVSENRGRRMRRNKPESEFGNVFPLEQVSGTFDVALEFGVPDDVAIVKESLDALKSSPATIAPLSR